MPSTVRAARQEDLPALVALLSVLFAIEADFTADPARQRRGLLALLADTDRCAILVAEEADRVVGMVTGQLVVSTAEGGPACWVEDLVVDGGRRGAGIGRHLLEAIEVWASLRGATRLQLVADRDNLPALAFYRRRAWRSTNLVALHRAIPSPA